MKRTIALLALLAVGTVAFASDWPAWRGPTGQGLCDEKGLPTKWSATENVKWKVPLENQSNSTPIVSGDTIFLTQANKGGSVRSLLCLARADGKQLWKKDVAYDKKERNWTEDWYCNASPATDGQRVVVSYGSAGMFCYDLDGKELWKRTDLGTFEHPFGNSASPVLYGDFAILWCGPNENGRNYLLAVDKKTGNTVWQQDQTYGSWCTPLIVSVNGQDQLILGHSPDIKNQPDDKTNYLYGFDPKTGKELWKCQGINSYFYASPLYSNGVAVGMSGYGGAALAVKLGGSGDITKDRLWKHPKSTQRVGSGVVVGEHIYMVDENLALHCYDLKTGEDQWKDQKRAAGSGTWGSIVHADGKLYILTKDANTLVLAASPKFQLLATNRLSPGEETNSSPVFSNGELFIRTFRHLWCIAEKK